MPLLSAKACRYIPATEYHCPLANIKNTACRHNYACAELILCNRPLTYVSSINCLGIGLYITSARTFICSYEHVKLKFYRAFNALYSRSHCSNSKMVRIELAKAYCLPLLLYGVEATAPSRQPTQMTDDVSTWPSKRFFKVSATENCTSIRYYVGFEHVAELIKKRKCKFMNSLVACHFDFEVLQFACTELFTFVS